MLEAPPQPARPWASASHAEILDALPYIDDDYGNPKVKEEVDRLVEEEMRRSTKKPADFLKDLAPLPTFSFQVFIFFACSLGFPLGCWGFLEYSNIHVYFFWISESPHDWKRVWARESWEATPDPWFFLALSSWTSSYEQEKRWNCLEAGTSKSSALITTSGH